MGDKKTISSIGVDLMEIDTDLSCTKIYVIVRPLSTVEYTSVATVFHSRQ